jgi:hypothetical protein
MPMARRFPAFCLLFRHPSRATMLRDGRITGAIGHGGIGDRNRSFEVGRPIMDGNALAPRSFPCSTSFTDFSHFPLVRYPSTI